MGNIPLEHGLIVASILFALGFYGVMVRRNFLFMLMSLEAHGHNQMDKLCLS